MHSRLFKIFSNHFIKKRHLLLVSLDWTRPKDPPMALGHAAIVANLRRHRVPHIEKSYAVNKPEFSPHSVVDFILQHSKQYPASDLAMGGFIWNENALQTILPQIRQGGFKGRIILGGPQVSYVKSGIERYYPLADVFIRGYAEEALAQLMISKDEKPIITGVHYANDPDLGLSAKIDLNDIPSPFLDGIVPPQSFIRWETQRGCPFRCSFCQHRESDSSQQRRHFHESRILREVEWITRHPIIKDIAVLDPTFNSGPNYLNVLTEFYNKGYTGKLSLQSRMEMVVPEFLDIVEKLNQKGQTVLEFGLQTIHKNEQALIQRPNNMKKVDAVLKETKKRKIPIEVSLIFGLPGQTVSSFQATVDYCKSHNIGTIYAYPLMLLRGTPLYDNKKQMGLQESSDIHIDEIPRIQSGIPHVVASHSFTFSEWRQMADIARSLDHYNQNMARSINRTAPPKITDNLQHTLWGKINTTKRNDTQTIADPDDHSKPSTPSKNALRINNALL